MYRGQQGRALTKKVNASHSNSNPDLNLAKLLTESGICADSTSVITSLSDDNSSNKTADCKDAKDDIN